MQQQVDISSFYIGMVEVVRALAQLELWDRLFDGLPRSGMVRATALRCSAFSLANAISIGFKSGL